MKPPECFYWLNLSLLCIVPPRARCVVRTADHLFAPDSRKNKKKKNEVLRGDLTFIAPKKPTHNVPEQIFWYYPNDGCCDTVLSLSLSLCLLMCVCVCPLLSCVVLGAADTPARFLSNRGCARDGAPQPLEEEEGEAEEERTEGAWPDGITEALCVFTGRETVLETLVKQETACFHSPPATATL